MQSKEAIKNVASVPGKYNITGGNINGNVNVFGNLGVTESLKTSKYLQIEAWEGFGTGTLNLWFDNQNGAGELTSRQLKDIKLGENYAYHTGRRPSPEDIGAAKSNHDHDNYVSGSGANGSTPVSDANDIWKSGFYDLDGGANVPFGDWVWLLNVAHTHNYPGYKYGLQIAAQNGTSNFAMRTTNVHGSGNWRTLWHTGNFDPGSWKTNGGQDLLVHGKRALVGFTNGELHLGYGGDFSSIKCGWDYTVWHSGNFDPGSKADNHDHPYIHSSASCNKNWNWSGQSGQPTWLWGGNDGTNMYVYNPSNFSVKYAASAGHSGNSDRIAGKNIFVQQSQPSPGATGDIWISW